MIHRRHVLAAIAVLLAAGGGLGAYLLWRIGAAGTYTGVSIHAVNAHGHALVFGWIGLMIMAGAYALLPRLWRTDLAAPGLVGTVFAAMLAGVVVSSAAMYGHAHAWAGPGVLVGGALQLAATLAFAGQVGVTFARSGRRLEPWSAFVLAGVGWFVIVAAASPHYAWATVTAPTRHDLLIYVMTYQAPLRDAQLRGFALFVLLGAVLRLGPALYGLPRVSRRRAWAALAMLATALAAMVALFLAYQWTRAPMLARGLWGAWVILAAGVLLIVAPWVWRVRRWRARGWGASAKFVRAAFIWLVVSLAMLIVLPLHQLASNLPFSHAYYGAVRHALAMGFVTMLIVGLTARLVHGQRGGGVPALWGAFVLLNVGCALRVGLQTLSDWHAWAFTFVGVSALLELTALAWWRAHVINAWRFESAAPPRIPGTWRDRGVAGRTRIAHKAAGLRP